ncbi:MAG TPA: hypothetical protein VMH79_01450 [Thermoanaerobaculia bacterium]|nr:hypothetical protein [Thermoanaerobaculia bacterium]
MCSLLTAEEVGVIFGKRVDASPSFRACEYDISPDRARPLEQLRVRLEVSGGAAAEADPGARHPRLGRDVMRTVHPGTSGPPDSLALGDGVSGVGDSASAVDVAAVERESGFSSRGRILEARQGSVHLTVGVTIAPDPGTRELDASLAAVAKTALARLAQAAGTKKPEK